MNVPLDSLYDPRAPWNQPDPITYKYKCILEVPDEDDENVFQIIELNVEFDYCGRLDELSDNEILSMINEELLKEFDDYDLLDYELA